MYFGFYRIQINELHKMTKIEDNSLSNQFACLKIFEKIQTSSLANKFNDVTEIISINLKNI